MISIRSSGIEELSDTSQLQDLSLQWLATANKQPPLMAFTGDSPAARIARDATRAVLACFPPLTHPPVNPASEEEMTALLKLWRGQLAGERSAQRATARGGSTSAPPAESSATVATHELAAQLALSTLTYCWSLFETEVRSTW